MSEHVDALLQGALDASVGLGVRCSDPEALQRQLHARRAELRALGLLAYEGITTRLNPKDQFELFILNGEHNGSRREEGLRPAGGKDTSNGLPSLADLLPGIRNAKQGGSGAD